MTGVQTGLLKKKQLSVFIKLRVSYTGQSTLIRVDSIVQVNETPFGTLIYTTVGKITVAESFAEVERLMRKASCMEREATND